MLHVIASVYQPVRTILRAKIAWSMYQEFTIRNRAVVFEFPRDLIHCWLLLWVFEGVPSIDDGIPKLDLLYKPMAEYRSGKEKLANQ
jgi:hypothetical protein